jgi:hypothetical protein
MEHGLRNVSFSCPLRNGIQYELDIVTFRQLPSDNLVDEKILNHRQVMKIRSVGNKGNISIHFLLGAVAWNCRFKRFGYTTEGV